MHECMFFVCMHACIHVCMHACIYVFLYVCMHACMYYVCIYVCMYAPHITHRMIHNTYIHTYIYTYIYMCLWDLQDKKSRGTILCMYGVWRICIHCSCAYFLYCIVYIHTSYVQCMHTYLHTCVRVCTYIHTCIHTYICGTHFGGTILEWDFPPALTSLCCTPLL